MSPILPPPQYKYQEAAASVWVPVGVERMVPVIPTQARHYRGAVF
jgi:hypothetical protein